MQSDDVLMARVLEGDDDAFGEIVDRYKDSLINYLTHLVRSRDRAEEVAQDAFVRLYRNASRYRERERLGSYLYRIATNLVISEARREKRWGLLLPRFHAGMHESAPAPDANLLVDEIRKEVTSALGRLPIKYRAPIVLYEIEEWPYEEIARAFDVPVGTVKSRISRGRQLLRRYLAPWWIGGIEHERHADRQLDAQSAAGNGVAPIQL